MKITFTPTTEGAKLTPPEPVRMHLPKWYKDVPPTTPDVAPFPKSGNFTIKKCIPVLDYLTSGYLMRFTTEVAIMPEEGTDEQGFGWELPMAMNMVDTHPHTQCPILINGKRRPYIRFNTEYVVRTPKGYSCLVYQPLMHLENRFTFISAIIDTDTYDGEMKATGWINNQSPFVIEIGTPMVALFPFKRDEWKMEVHSHLFDKQRSKVEALLHRKFYNFYKQYFHKKKRYD
jgi:hypothetical protein